MKIKLSYSLGKEFIFETESGKTYTMDENAPRPMELLLISLSGCTGIDVVEILGKMKVPYEKLEIFVDGKRASEHPRRYEYIKIIYKFYGKKLSEYREKIERAVLLSQEKYCSVKASLNSDINHEIEIIDL
ncbi:MAG: OsmC family protein [candidate division WOR-3 bacterium]|nr:OsmC family protein [candidate division WOR-3 bacterium]MCX7948019.1 OsmC family protein [candidate division WOR-3 bacterium]MDW8151083.1 OsmC family protein [candidate division WOR-3 bacterium]